MSETRITPPTSGEIITFYSYKGGTGRSMALANAACLLAASASKERGVLMIDWDLEAPGLHRYFHPHIEVPGERFRDVEQFIDEKLGLLDLFLQLETQIPKSGFGKDPAAFAQCKQWLVEADLKKYRLSTKFDNLFLLKAGKFDKEYSHNVNSFDWDDLHRRSSVLFQAFAEHLRESYDYVLIDSRTGLTDTSGICTTLMPEKLVVVFTPNKQSFTGVANLIKSATEYRTNSDDVRPLAVFPLPSRIESLREQLRKDWRFGNAEREIEGYQPLFTRLFREIYGLDENECDLDEYFSEVQIQQSPDLAFGEEIAVNLDEQQDRFSVARSYETFTHKLINLDLPWEIPPPLEAVFSDADGKQLAEFAEKVYSRFDGSQQTIVRRIFTRLVRAALPGEGADTVKGAGLSEFGPGAGPILESLIESRLLSRHRAPEAGEDTIEIANEVLIRTWTRLQEWINEDRDFLLWRQFLRAYLTEWEKNDRESDYLLTGTALSKAISWVNEQVNNLNKAERDYISVSIEHDRNLTATKLPWYRQGFKAVAQKVPALVGAVVAVVFVGYLLVNNYRDSRDTKATAQALELTSKGRNAYALENYQGAIQFYNQALDAKADYASAYLNRADAYKAMKDSDKAMVDYQKVLMISTDNDLKAIAQKGIDEINKGNALPSPEPPAQVGSGNSSPTPTASPSQAPIAPRLYVTLQDANQKEGWFELEKKLRGSGYLVPNAPRIGSSDVRFTQVRYYRKAEADEANQLVTFLSMNGVDAKPVYLNDEDNPSRMRHFEIVFSRFAFQSGTQQPK